MSADAPGDGPLKKKKEISADRSEGARGGEGRGGLLKVVLATKAGVWQRRDADGAVETLLCRRSTRIGR